MKANTAVGLIVSAAGLWGFTQRRVTTRVAGWGLVCLGGVTIVEYATGWSLGIDEFLAIDTTGMGTPGRMGLNNAVCFTALGLSYLATTLPLSIATTSLPAAVTLLSIAVAA
jgi:hypothetical protein